MSWSDLNTALSGRRFFRYDEAEANGVPRSTVDDRSRREAWPPRPHAGLILTPGPALSDRERVAAAVYSVAGPTAVGGESALFLHGVRDRAPARTVLWLPPSNRARSDQNREVRRSSLLRREDLVRLDGIPTVAGRWAMRDVADRYQLAGLRSLGLDLRFAGLVDDDGLADVLKRDRRFAGRKQFAQVAEELRGDGSDSGFEFETRDRLIDAGIPIDAQQHPVGGWGRRNRRLDLAITGAKVGIECVGLAYHRDRLQLERDAERSNDIAATGEWVVLQMTWLMRFEPGWSRFLSRLRAALASRSMTA